MHDGSLATLEAVIDHYAAGGKMEHPNKSHILRPFHVTDGEKQDLIEFLKSLTDEQCLVYGESHVDGAHVLNLARHSEATLAYQKT